MILKELILLLWYLWLQFGGVGWLPETAESRSLVSRLGSARWRDRELAERALLRLGWSGLGSVRRGMSGRDLEVSLRCVSVYESYLRPPPGLTIWDLPNEQRFPGGYVTRRHRDDRGVELDRWEVVEGFDVGSFYYRRAVAAGRLGWFHWREPRVEEEAYRLWARDMLLLGFGREWLEGVGRRSLELRRTFRRAEVVGAWWSVDSYLYPPGPWVPR